jgi:copper homeostasis protein
MNNFLFELCAESLKAARAAEFGGADRIELCSELAIGGVTPAADLMTAVIQSLTIPVHVLIRPRAGDFVFSRQEFGLMLRQIEQAREAGAAGVAIGVLLRDRRVDVERSRKLVDAGRPMKVTFHRAFDEAADLDEALEAVIQTGADCLLTSGGAPDVLAGADTIARLHLQAGPRLKIMAGGGLRLANLVEVARRTGVSSLHGSLTRKANSAERNPAHSTNGRSVSSDATRLEADVRKLVRLLRQEVQMRESASTRA